MRVCTFPTCDMETHSPNSLHPKSSLQWLHWLQLLCLGMLVCRHQSCLRLANLSQRHRQQYLPSLAGFSVTDNFWPSNSLFHTLQQPWILTSTKWLLKEDEPDVKCANLGRKIEAVRQSPKSHHSTQASRHPTHDWYILLQVLLLCHCLLCCYSHSPSSTNAFNENPDQTRPNHSNEIQSTDLSPLALNYQSRSMLRSAISLTMYYSKTSSKVGNCHDNNAARCGRLRCGNDAEIPRSDSETHERSRRLIWTWYEFPNGLRDTLRKPDTKLGEIVKCTARRARPGGGGGDYSASWGASLHSRGAAKF